MQVPRSHEVVVDDGVTIRATVHGEGPPLVLLQGVLGDGDVDWRALLPHLVGRFTCHLPSMRGRGRSDGNPNLRIDRIVTDYTTYVESVGEPVGLVGWSSGAGHALAVASRSAAVRATAAYEPIAGPCMDEEQRAALGGALVRGRELVDAGDLPGATRAMAAFPFTPDDLDAADAAGYFRATGRYAPHVLDVFGQLVGYDGVMPEAPEVLSRIDAPVTVLHGSGTRPLFTASAQHVLDHLPQGRRHVVPGAGHAGPLTHPADLADELRRLFEDTSASG
ncbi:alpha/beta fold hydrolase [Aquipuribacter sp. SD81]|uniref:alpha/beta fold hydrolase n=1 Tax=Aquipuribacter sp. SD81 TaxID=3127703 RepID=UPI00301B5673